MANWDFYKRHLGISSADSLYEIITKTLIETNHTCEFFVNWSKVVKNTDSYKYELALLKSLQNSKNPPRDLKDLLMKYPEVAKVIPVLVACRDSLLKVLYSTEPFIQYKIYDFAKDIYTPIEIDELVEFTQKSGLLNVLCHMDSSSDYLLGVEVGLDSNARKNRSGSFLEALVRLTIGDIIKRHPGTIWVEQKYFAFIQSSYGIRVPSSLLKRKFDHVIISNNKPTNIEINFYSGTGSKPSEIVNSYSNRNQLLTSTGWKFVWLTDGYGWKAMRNPLYLGIENIEYTLNVNLLKKGLLEKIIFNQ